MKYDFQLTPESMIQWTLLIEYSDNTFRDDDSSQTAPSRSSLLFDENSSLPNDQHIPYAPLPPSIDDWSTPPYDMSLSGVSAYDEYTQSDDISWLEINDNISDSFPINSTNEYVFGSELNIHGISVVPNELCEVEDIIHGSINPQLLPITVGCNAPQTREDSGGTQLPSPAPTPKQSNPPACNFPEEPAVERTRKPAWGKKQEDKIPLNQISAVGSKGSSHKSGASARQAGRSTRVVDKTLAAPAKAMEKAPSGGRVTHNMIERQYRTRLNGHFEELFQSLPENMRVEELDTNNANAPSSTKKISKGEVLMKAREYIQDLEREGEVLREDNEKLRAMKEEFEINQVAFGGISRS